LPCGTGSRRSLTACTPQRLGAAVRGVFVHCWGGVGRTGTVVGCWHVARGTTADEALEKIAVARLGTRKAVRESPEMPGQVDMIHEMADRRERSN